MNAGAFMASAFLAPLRSTRRGMHWFAVAIMLLAAASVTALGIFSHKPEAQLVDVMAVLLAFGLAFLNAFALAPTLLLAIDAKQLCLPGLQRMAWVSVAMYAGLELVSTTLPLALLTGPVATVAAILALGIIAGILWGVSPRYVSVLIGFGPMAFNAFHENMHLPSAGQPGFLTWVAGMILFGIIAAALCWRRELRARSPYGQGMSRPLVTQFRNNARGGWNAWSGFAGGAQDTSFMIRQRPDWMQPRTDLQGTGPSDIALSVRVALGGMFMPQTWSSRLRSAGSVVLPGLVFILVMGLAVHADHKADVVHVLRKMAAAAMVWGGGFGGSMVVLLSLAQLQQRWSRPNGELSLLALLPGLGPSSTVRRDVLAASLFPMRIQLALLIITLALACWLGIHAEGLFLIALSQLVSMGGTIALQRCVLGRCMPSAWILTPLCFLGFSLLTASLSIALIDGTSPAMTPAWLDGALAAGWSALILALLWLGRRGGQAWKRRTHPFLVP
jgi:hypothetical protein